MTKLLGPAMRLGGVGAAVLALAASSTDGQRAQSGWCPSGEQCADETPEGLEFEGAQVSWFIGNGVAATATGGRQAIKLVDKATGEPLDGAFLATATNTLVHAARPDGAAQAIVSTTGDGDGYLRISRVADDYLFDRVAVSSRPIASMAAIPTVRASWPNIAGARWAAFAGGNAEVAVALYDAAGGWLVDDGMTITTPTDSRRTGWDAVEITPTAAGTYDLRVAAGTLTDTVVPVTVVDAIATVEPWDSSATHAVGSDAEACFGATTSDGVSVYGVPWRFDLTGPIVAAPAVEQLHARCLKVRFTGVGTATVTAIGGGRTGTSTYTVISSAARVRPSAPWVTPRDLGERAAASADAPAE